jgi:drug/metabolite transporter (DMT)-like permease
MTRLSLSLLVIASLAAAGGQMLFKIGASDRQHLPEFLNVPIMLGLILYGASTVIWIRALAEERLTTVYAFTALTYAFVYLGAVAVIGERLTFIGLLGITLVLTGLYLIMKAAH